jgi:hypothetical protein
MQTSSPNILNPETVCEGCGIKFTSDGEWVMDVFACDNQHEYCLNCCGCPSHVTTEEGIWYE